MVLTSIAELATGFEGCEKKIEVDFELNNDDKIQFNNNKSHKNIGLRRISRSSIDRILSLARCTVISVTSNQYFDSYVLSESSLFIYPNKAILKTCGTTLLLKSLPELLTEAKNTCNAYPDFLQFSRSNFIFPNKQLYPHRAFSEETDYLGKVLQPLLYNNALYNDNTTSTDNNHVNNSSHTTNISPRSKPTNIQSSAYILGPINGPRWHLYTVDWNRIDATDYTQQTLEIVMFNLDSTRMKTFYKRDDNNSDGHVGIGYPCSDGKEATIVSGIDTLLPGSIIDSNLFTPCGYSCNGLLDEYYFTIHITPEPECSFVSFETNVVMSNYTELVRKVIDIFKPATWTMSLFVDEKSLIPDSRAGCSWSYDGYNTTGTTSHIFPSQYNATCAQFESLDYTTAKQQQNNTEYGYMVENNINAVTSPTINGISADSLTQHIAMKKLTDHDAILDVPTTSINAYSYSNICDMSLLQMRESVISISGGRFIIEPSDVLPIINDHNDALNNSSSHIVRNSAQNIIKQHLPEQSFTLVDIGSLIRKYYLWTRILKNITPVYHVYNHVDKGIISTLACLGSAFACNSINAARSLLRYGINAQRITLNSPHLPFSTLQFAREKGIELITVHTTVEVQQVATHYHNASLLILYSFDYQHTLGVDSTDDLHSIIKQAKQHNLSVAGIRLNLPVNLPLQQVIQHLHTIHNAINECNTKIEVLDLSSYSLNIDNSTLDDCNKLISTLSELYKDVEIFANCEPFMNDHTSGLALNVLEKRVHDNNTTSADNEQKEVAVINTNLKRSRGNDETVDVTYYVADDTLTDTINYRNEVIANITRQPTPRNNKQPRLSAISSVSGSSTAYINELVIPTTDQHEWIYLPNIDPINPTKLTDAPNVYYIAS